jgi:hypothetical protein
MSNFSIVNVSAIDNTGALSVGTNASTTSVVLGRTGITTNINGSLQINGSSGTANQVLTSGGSGAPPTWTTPSFVSNATSNLNMSNFSITNVTGIDSNNGILNIGTDITKTNRIILGDNSHGNNKFVYLSNIYANNISNDFRVYFKNSSKRYEFTEDNIVMINSGGSTVLSIGTGGIRTRNVTEGIPYNNPAVINYIFDMSIDIMSLKSSLGTSGQVITANASSSPYWANPSFVSNATSNLNMSNFSIVNVSAIDNTGSLSVGTNASTTTTIIGRIDKPITLLGNIINLSTNNISLTTLIDSNTTRSFNSKYLSININNTSYYIPLFI